MFRKAPCKYTSIEQTKKNKKKTENNDNNRLNYWHVRTSSTACKGCALRRKSCKNSSSSRCVIYSYARSEKSQHECVCIRWIFSRPTGWISGQSRAREMSYYVFRSSILFRPSVCEPYDFLNVYIYLYLYAIVCVCVQ